MEKFTMRLIDDNPRIEVNEAEEHIYESLKGGYEK